MPGRYESLELIDLRSWSMLSEAGVQVENEWQYLSAATGVSADGRIVVGYGTNTAGTPQAFRATLGRVLCDTP